MQNKLNYKRTFFIGLAFLSISAFWQMYDNIIPLMLQKTFQLGETVTGVIMALDNVLAIFLLPVFGALSDRVDTRFGKRIPFIVVGTVLAVGFMMLMPYADHQANLALFAAALFCTLLAMGLYRSPAVALMPDLTPNRMRSKANAVINLMGAVGGIFALIMIKFLVGAGERPDYFPLFASIAVLMAAAVIILVLTIRENKLKRELAADLADDVDVNGEEKKEAETAGKTVLPKAVKRSMSFMLASIFLWFMAYNAVTTAFSRYAKEVWQLEGGGFADCLMVSMAAAIVSFIPLGSVSAKFGRKKTIMGGVLLMALCFFAAIFAVNYHPVINVAFALIGVAWAAINVNSYPMIVAMSESTNIGKFTGTYYTFSMAAQIVTPVLSGFLLETISYKSLFPYAFVFSILAFMTMTQVRHGDVKPLKKESVLENFDVDD